MAKRRKFSHADKALVRTRARSICEYCQMPEDFETDTFEMEHIIPLVRNGTNDLDNIAFSCSGCNNRKGISIEGIDSQTSLVAPLFHPRLQRWEEHFTWSVNNLMLIGISPTGRTTIEMLQLNRTGCINLRRALIAIGEHPPTRS